MPRNSAKSKTSRSGHGILVFFLILLLGLIIGLVAILPQFYIREITIEGERKISEEEVLDTAGIEEGKHLFLYLSGDLGRLLQFRYGEIEDRLIQAYPYIDQARVQVRFPYKVAVELEERVEVAWLKTAVDYAVVDSEGRILERVSEDPPSSVPVIEGVVVGNRIPNEQLSEEEFRVIERTLEVIYAVIRIDRDAQDTFSLMNQIQSYYPYAASTLYFTLTDSEGKPLTVRLNPNQNVEAKLLWLRNAWQQGVLNDLGQGVLDLSGEQNIFSPSQTVPAIATPTPAPTPTETSSEPTDTSTEETTPTSETMQTSDHS